MFPIYQSMLCKGLSSFFFHLALDYQYKSLNYMEIEIFNLRP